MNDVALMTMVVRLLSVVATSKKLEPRLLRQGLLIGPMIIIVVIIIIITIIMIIPLPPPDPTHGICQHRHHHHYRHTIIMASKNSPRLASGSSIYL